MTTQVSKGTLPYEKEQKILKQIREMNKEIGWLRITLEGWDIVEGMQIARAADLLSHNAAVLKQELL